MFRTTCLTGIFESASRPFVSLSLVLLLFGLIGCNGDENAMQTVSGPTQFAVVGPENPASGLAIGMEQFITLLGQASNLPVRSYDKSEQVSKEPGTRVFALGPSATSEALIPALERDALPSESYILRQGSVNGMTVLAGAGPDNLGNQYAAYAILDLLGFGFFHPEETYIPPAVTLPRDLDQTRKPSYRWRGMSAHTMHSIELVDSLLVPSAQHLSEVKRYVDWLVANRQNYFQWVLQDTIDIDAWLPHAAGIVEYAHDRGLEVGIDTPLEFIQQNAFALAPETLKPFEPQIERNLAWILQAPFDVINVELGAAEALPVDDERTMEMLNFTAAHLDEVYGVELISKVHCTTGQTAPHFDDINFNFLPGIADPRVGVMPHTVQFYDLYRSAPTYGNEDFSDMRRFLLDEIGERTVLYYPETAYFVTFDIDIPIYLPHYVFSRWNDLHRLRESGMDGQINFASGFEWGYWLNDWSAAGFAYEASTHWTDYLTKFTRIFGAGAADMQQLLKDLIEEQGRDLLEDNLIAYLIGWDSADDFGDIFADTNFQPRRVLFREIRAMDAAQLAEFEANVLTRLADLETTYDTFAQRVTAIAPRIPEQAVKWYREVKRALEVTALRVQHVLSLNRGTVSRRKAQLGIDPEGEVRAEQFFVDALNCRRTAEQIIALQEQDYRWPVERIARPRENPTSYEFGYLYTVSDCYYWRREEFQAIEDNECFCLANLTNLIANLFGEGHPLDNLARNFPPILGPCLNQCLHPIAKIEEIIYP